jgi:DNA-binding winged helix-turn-helix (wHTH) protein/pimeloyl-ACP methyl ester carboxylesterase
MASGPQVLRFGPFVLDVAEHSLSREGQPIVLTPKLFALLTVLAENSGRLMSKDALMQAVWPDAMVEEGNVSKGIFLLRQALGDTGNSRALIETVPRVGYRFIAAVTRRGPSAVAAPRPTTPGGPRTRYAKSGDVHIAYQVVGDAGPDLVLVPGWVSHVEYAWEEPSVCRFLQRLAAFSRLILIDRRGTGLSDRVIDLPSLEQRMGDVRAVMDAAGSERAALFGISEGGPMCLMFAATYPQRTSALVLCGTTARITNGPDYTVGVPADELTRFTDHIASAWGSGVSADVFAPNLAADPAFRQSWGRFERFAVSPAGIRALLRMLHDTVPARSCLSSKCRRSSSIGKATAPRQCAAPAIWPSGSPEPGTSSCPATTTCHGSAMWTRSWIPSRSSSPARVHGGSRIASSPHSLYRHRRLDGPRGRDGRPALARPARQPRRDRATRVRPVRRARGEDRRGLVSDDVRRTGALSVARVRFATACARSASTSAPDCTPENAS